MFSGQHQLDVVYEVTMSRITRRCPVRRQHGLLVVVFCFVDERCGGCPRSFAVAKEGSTDGARQRRPPLKEPPCAASLWERAAKQRGATGHDGDDDDGGGGRSATKGGGSGKGGGEGRQSLLGGSFTQQHGGRRWGERSGCRPRRSRLLFWGLKAKTKKRNAPGLGALH